MGLSLVALKAGIKPIIDPNNTNKARATNTTAMETDALTRVASSPCPQTLSMTIRIQPPVMMPKIPESKV